MRAAATAGPGRSAPADPLRAAQSNLVAGRRRVWTALWMILGLFQRLGRRLAGRRRPRLEGWTAMDPRLLADIGVTRRDLHAVLYAGAPLERLGARHADQQSGEVMQGPRCPASRLRLVGLDDLDAAA